MTNRQINVTAGTIAYRDLGTGPTLVFIHGAFVNGRLWDPVLAELGGQFRCIVPELPFVGHKTAMNPDADLTPPGCAKLIAEFLERLDLHDVTLIANDTGGAITQLVAADHPETTASSRPGTPSGWPRTFPMRRCRPSARHGPSPRWTAPTWWRR